jgi:hypothetical protein
MMFLDVLGSSKHHRSSRNYHKEINYRVRSFLLDFETAGFFIN